MGVFRMIDVNGQTEKELTPFEQAKLNVELFATNMMVCYGFQQAIADLRECELQLATLEDPEIRATVVAEQEHATARIMAAHKITEALDIFCA